VREGWGSGTQRVKHIDLPGRVVQVIIAAYDVRNCHVEIIDDHGEIVGGRAVGSGNNQVVELRIVENHGAPDLVFDNDIACVWVPKTNDRIYTLARLLSITATPVVPDLRTTSQLPGTKFIKLSFRAIAAICFVFFEPLLNYSKVSLKSPGLKKRTFVGIQSQPVQSIEYRLDVFVGRSLAISVLDTQDEGPLVMSRIKPTE
jgi:hypothetical protein